MLALAVNKQLVDLHPRRRLRLKNPRSVRPPAQLQLRSAADHNLFPRVGGPGDGGVDCPGILRGEHQRVCQVVGALAKEDGQRLFPPLGALPNGGLSSREGLEGLFRRARLGISAGGVHVKVRGPRRCRGCHDQPHCQGPGA